MAQFGNVNEAISVVGHVIQLEIYSVYGPQVAVNLRHYRVANPMGAGTTFSHAMTALSTALKAPMADLLNLNARFNGIGLRDVTVSVQPAAAYDDTDAVVGAVAGDALPRQVCGLIKLTTTLSGRGGRGRLYVPFPSEVDSSAGATPIGSYVTRLTALATVLRATHTVGAGGNTVDLVPVLFRRTTRTFVTVTGAVARTQWATQRRRGDFGRTNVPPV